MRDDFTDLSRQFSDRFEQSDQATHRLITGVKDEIVRLNGKIQDAHVKIAGHETALTLAHERLEMTAKSGHELRSVLSAQQTQLGHSLLLIERIQNRADTADAKAVDAAALAVDVASKLSEAQKNERFTLASVIWIALTASGAVYGIIQAIIALKP
ncbi:MAG: hypothetical protein NUW22_04865 [Acidobacteria bacterium]|nr:hypothetical protein [Acidobacteriota bacterium]